MPSAAVNSGIIVGSAVTRHTFTAGTLGANIGYRHPDVGAIGSIQGGHGLVGDRQVLQVRSDATNIRFDFRTPQGILNRFWPYRFRIEGPSYDHEFDAQLPECTYFAANSGGIDFDSFLFSVSDFAPLISGNDYTLTVTPKLHLAQGNLNIGSAVQVKGFDANGIYGTFGQLTRYLTSTTRIPFRISNNTDGASPVNPLQDGYQCDLLAYYDNSSPARFLYFHLTTKNIPNSGWDTLTVGGNNFARTNANYDPDNSSLGGTLWTWVDPDDPFGAATDVEIIVV